jgi:tetratricopeptide (TPR) repeat protein
VLVGLLVTALIATAITHPLNAQGTITVEPNQLTLTQQRGAVVERTLFVQAETSLTELDVIVLDLSNQESGAQIPGAAITIDLEATSLAAGDRLQVPVRFDLAQIPAGDYQGDLRITYAGGSLAIPVTIQVKDPPWLPLITLVAGVALGIGVSNYRARGRPRDIVMVRLGQIRTQMKADQKLQTLGSPFETRIESDLTEAEIALEAQQWEEAQTAVDRAYALWSQWRQARPDWLAQLDVYTDFIERLQEIDTDAAYISDLRQSAEDHYQDIPNLAGPQAFRDQLESLIDRAEDFLRLRGRIRTLGSLSTVAAAQAEVYRDRLKGLDPLASDFESQRTELESEIEQAIIESRQRQLEQQVEQYQRAIRRLPEDARSELDEKLRTLREDIEALEPGDEAGYVRTLNRVTGMADEIPASTTRGGELEVLRSGNLGFPGGIAKAAAVSPEMDRMAITLPGVRVKSLDAQIGSAGRRLQWFTWITYGLAVTLLALAGFIELYEGQSTFGSAGVADYFTLLAWGFGSEATRSAVATMIQGWGIIQQ